MKLLTALLMLIAAPAWSQIPISALPNATTPLTGSELTIVVQNAVTSKTTVSAFAPVIFSTAANSVLGNATASAAAPTSLAVPSCSTTGSALKWTTSSGFSCNTAIDAATLLTATWASPAAIGTGTPAAGTFTALTLSSPLTVANGGSGLATRTAHSLQVGNGTSNVTQIAVGATGQYLKGATGADPTWGTVSSDLVSSIAFGTTGLTPSAATAGAVTVAGTLVAANGGTGFASYTVGDLLYADSTTTLAKRASVAAGQALMSAGAGAAPAYTGSPSLSGSVTAGTGLTVTTGGAAITGNSSVTGTFGATGVTTLGNSLTNYVTVSGNASGFPSINAVGSTNSGLVYTTEGSGTHYFNTNNSGTAGGGVTQVEILHTASSSNYVTLTGSNGGNPTVGTTGGNFAITPAGARTVMSHATVPIFQLNVSGSGADLKHWDIGANATGLFVQAGNDADAASTQAYNITRGTTTNVASHHFYTSTVAGTGVEGFEILNTNGANHVQVQSGTNPVINVSGGSLAITPATLFASTVSATQYTSTIATGTAPLVVASTTNVANLNASTLTGSAVGTSGATIPLLNTANTYSAKQLFNGSTSVAAVGVTNIVEPGTISATAATGTINYDLSTQSILYYTTNAAANWTTNFRWSSGTSANTAMATGDIVTAVFMVTQGASPFYNNVIQVDGNAITPKWQGGTAPAAGNASGIDIYTYTIIKTGNAAFTILGTQVQYK